MLTIESVPVPFFAEIKNGLPHAAEVELTGEAIYGQDRGIWFEYKTLDGTALHLNIRMGQNNQNVIVVNSYHHGSWGHEEQEFSTVNPPGPVQIFVKSHDHHYDITVNSRSFRFPHRLKKHDINRLEIRGDLIIRRMTFRNMENHVQLLGNYQRPGYAPSLPYGGPVSLGQAPPYQPYGQPSLNSQPSPLPYGAPQPLGQGLGQGYYPNQSQPSAPYGLGQQPPSGPSYYRS